jgi:predicted Zn-dependent protease
MSNKSFRLKDFEIISLGLEVTECKRYRLDENKQKQLFKIREFHNSNFQEVKRTLNKDGETISKVEKLVPDALIDIPDNHQIKRVSTNVSTKQQWVITEPIKTVNIEKEIDFLSIFKDKIQSITLNYQKDFNAITLFDRLVYTDVHIGMNVNQNGYALYDGLWNEEELNNRLSIMVNYTLQHKQSNYLIIHELGDFMDGFDGFTTRGGHALPQNMDNQMAFDAGLKFKIRLIDALIPYYEVINCVNICNDNHAGSFGYIVNSAFKTYIELKYPNKIEVINQRKFIDHYIVNNRCFILTHGKDDKSLKFGFKPQIDAVQIEKIKNYIDEYKLHNFEVEFSKGDSHQLIFDLTSSTAFEYQNFGAFSPPSDWVKTNFKNTKSSFTVMNYYEKQKTINNYIF